MKKIVLILGMIAVIALGWFVIIQTKNAKPREIQKHLELAQKKRGTADLRRCIGRI